MQIKNEEYHTVGTIPKSNRQVLEAKAKAISLKHI